MAHTITRRLIGTTLTQIVDGRTEWRKIDIAGLGALGLVYVGFDRTLNTTNGHPLPANQQPYTLYLAPGYQLWAIGSAADGAISVLETTGGPEIAIVQALSEGLGIRGLVAA